MSFAAWPKKKKKKIRNHTCKVPFATWGDRLTGSRDQNVDILLGVGWGSICYSAYHRVKKASLKKEYLSWKLSTSQKWEEKEQLSQQSKQQGQRPWGESFWSPSTGDKPRRGKYRMQTRWRGSGRQAPWAVMKTLGFIPVLSGATGKPEPVTDMTWLVSEGTMVRVLLTRWRKPSVLWGAEFGCSVVVWMGRDPGPN